MAAPSLEPLRPRAVALALAVDPTGKTTAAKLRPYLLAQGQVYVQRAAARSMALLGDAGVGELNALSYSKEDSMRLIAVAALADSAPLEKRLALTARLLDDVSPGARIDAANALAAMGPAGRDVLIGQVFKHPEALHALERTSARRTAMLPSLRSLTQTPRLLDEKAQATVIDAVRAVESGRAAAADRALLDCLESDASPVRQWASGIVGESGTIARAGPVTQARVLSLMTQPRFAPVVRTPLVAAPPAPADAREWAMPSAVALSAMTTATQEISEPPSELAWWATGGFAVVMAFCLKRLARGDHGQGELEAQLLDEDGDDDGDADESPTPGLAA